MCAIDGEFASPLLPDQAFFGMPDSALKECSVSDRVRETNNLAVTRSPRFWSVRPWFLPKFFPNPKMAKEFRYNPLILLALHSRLKLPIARKPVFVRIAPGISLGYRRNQVAGTWVLKVADGKGGAHTQAIGTADDHDDANGTTVLTFWQAQEKAKVSA
jgi:hypothetical protein